MKKTRKEILEYQVTRSHIESIILMTLATSIGKAAHKAMKEYIKYSDRLEKRQK